MGQKSGPQTHDHNSVKSEPMKNFFAAKFLGKFVVKWILKLSPHLAYVATPRFRFDRIVAMSVAALFGPPCYYRVRGVDGSCAKHLTVESYTVVMLLTFILIITSFTSPLTFSFQA